MTNFTFRRTRRVAVGRIATVIVLTSPATTSFCASDVVEHLAGFLVPREHRRRATMGLCGGDVPRSGQGMHRRPVAFPRPLDAAKAEP